jgi:membrane-bound metal-dependent hydrolase YbcI (DUF457 family)
MGHALAGIAAAWAADLLPGRRTWRTAPSAPVFPALTDSVSGFFSGAGGALTLAAAALGVAPDLDLFLAEHRAITHSIGAVAAVFIVAWVVTGQVTRKVQSAKYKVQSKSEVQRTFDVHGGTFHVGPVLRIAMICAAAYGSHLLLDWLAIDRRLPYGLQILWPFSDRWYISGLDIFLQTERRNLLTLATLHTNLRAMSFEIAVMLPVLVLVWLVHVKTTTRLSAEVAGRHHAP